MSVDIEVSEARKKRRQHILDAASALVGQEASEEFDPVHSPLCAIDVVMAAGSPWLQDGLARDFLKDESGYKKIGGGANTPAMAYFYRSTINLVHYLKRQGFYTPRGSERMPCPGMACFFDFDDRGRFNFTPDRSGLIVAVAGSFVSEVVVARSLSSDIEEYKGFVVKRVSVKHGDEVDGSLIGYSDLP